MNPITWYRLRRHDGHFEATVCLIQLALASTAFVIVAAFLISGLRVLLGL